MKVTIKPLFPYVMCRQKTKKKKCWFPNVPFLPRKLHKVSISQVACSASRGIVSLPRSPEQNVPTVLWSLRTRSQEGEERLRVSQMSNIPSQRREKSSL